MKIPLTAKRVFKWHDQIVFDIKGFKTPVRIKLEKTDYVQEIVSSAESGNKKAIEFLKNVLLSKIFSDLEVNIK